MHEDETMHREACLLMRNEGILQSKQFFEHFSEASWVPILAFWHWQAWSGDEHFDGVLFMYLPEGADISSITLDGERTWAWGFAPNKHFRIQDQLCS